MKDEWEYKKLDELGVVKRGKSKHRPRNDPCLFGGEYPFVQTSDVKNATLTILNYSQTYNETGLKQSKLWDSNTLCITIAANIAETGLLTFPACFPDSIVGFTPSDGKSDVRFVKYKIDELRRRYQNISKGTAQDNLSLNKLLSIKLKVPSFKTQQKIGTFLSNYDYLIESNNKRISLLENTAKLIYKEWFIKFKFPGHEKLKTVDSKTDFGKIPEGWKIKKLSELVETQYGYTETASTKKNGPKFLRGKDINKAVHINWSSVPYCKISSEDFKKYKLNIGDILIIRMADPGKVGIVESPLDAVFASYLIRLKITGNLSPYYFFYFLLSDKYQNYIRGASTGTTRKSASAGVITGTNILIPNKTIIKLFEEQIEDIRTEITNLIQKNTCLKDTRDLLLPKLISGEVDVSGMNIRVSEVVA